MAGTFKFAKQIYFVPPSPRRGLRSYRDGGGLRIKVKRNTVVTISARERRLHWQMWKKYLKDLRFPESYISITLGFLVVVVGGLLLYNFLTKYRPGTISTNSTENQTKTQEVAILPTTHKVGDNETLWTIAQKYYNSGYNWVTLAQANKLVNPDKIEVGQELSIPKAETIMPLGEVSSTSVEKPKSYTVVKGDDLWHIAIREYGDGYSWTKIAQANKLLNPNLIYPGNVLTLPR